MKKPILGFKASKEIEQDLVTLIINRVGSIDLIRQKGTFIRLLDKANKKGILTNRDTERMEGLLNFLDTCTDQIKDGKAIVEVKANSLKIGDKVKILPTVRSNKTPGFSCMTNQKMKDAVGNVYKVEYVDSVGDVKLSSIGFWWHKTWLKKTNEKLTK